MMFVVLSMLGKYSQSVSLRGTQPPTFANQKLPKIIYHLNTEVTNGDGAPVGGPEAF